MKSLFCLTLVSLRKLTRFEYYAIKDTCPHKATAPLLRGKLDGLGVKCPNHGYRFDLKTGECNVDSVYNTKVFDVKVENNKVLIKLD